MKTIYKEELYIQKLQSHIIYDIINQHTHNRIKSFLVQSKSFMLLKKYEDHYNYYDTNYDIILENLYIEILEKIGEKKGIKIIEDSHSLKYEMPIVDLENQQFYDKMTLEELICEEAYIKNCMFNTLNTSYLYSTNTYYFSQLIPYYDYIINQIHEIKRLTARSWADEAEELELEDTKLKLKETETYSYTENEDEDEDEEEEEIFMDSFEYLDNNDIDTNDIDTNDIDTNDIDMTYNLSYSTEQPFEEIENPSTFEEIQLSSIENDAYKLWYS